MVVTPQTVDPLAYNPIKISAWNPSGGDTNCAASDLGDPKDWYIHEQGMQCNYERFNKYVNCEPSMRSGTEPYVESNYVEVIGDAWTNDRIIFNATISACVQQLQKLSWTASGACSGTGSPVAGAGGLGESGRIDTSTVGVILRPVVRDALGIPSDPSGGYQTGQINIITNEAPGYFECSGPYDTRHNALISINHMVNAAGIDLETFEPNLVNI